MFPGAVTSRERGGSPLVTSADKKGMVTGKSWLANPLAKYNPRGIKKWAIKRAQIRRVDFSSP